MTRRVLLHSGEDGYVVAEVPSLPGCISQGKTREDALQNIREAISLHEEVLRERGEPVPGNAIRLSWSRSPREQVARTFQSSVCQSAEQSRLRGLSPRGSHIMLIRRTPPAQTTIPNHKELDRGTLRAIIRQTGLTVEEFLALL